MNAAYMLLADGRDERGLRQLDGMLAQATRIAAEASAKRRQAPPEQRQHQPAANADADAARGLMAMLGGLSG